MIEVARLANVSTMTVSRVLSASVYVSPETASRVRAVVDQLGYQPNEMARVLRSAKSKMIGVIVPTLADSFFAICAHNINAVIQEHGYSMVLTTSNASASTEFSEAMWMLQQQVEGLIICPSPDKVSRLSNPIFQRTPIVSFDRPLHFRRTASVLTENGAGAKRGTEHLIEHGHKRIHFLGDAPDLYTIKTRFDGYRRAMLSAGRVAECSLECNTERSVFEYVKEVLAGKNAPTAFLGGNNRVSQYLYRALSALGYRIPEDVAVVGFDDFEMADMLNPPLTAIRQPVEALGRTAAEVLFAKLEAEPEDFPEVGSRTTLKVELVLRSSCGCRKASDQTSKILSKRTPG